MAWLILGVLALVAAALSLGPLLWERPAGEGEADAASRRPAYREDLRQDFLMGKLDRQAYEAALKEEDEES